MSKKLEGKPRYWYLKLLYFGTFCWWFSQIFYGNLIFINLCSTFAKLHSGVKLTTKHIFSWFFSELTYIFTLQTYIVVFVRNVKFVDVIFIWSVVLLAYLLYIKHGGTSCKVQKIYEMISLLLIKLFWHFKRLNPHFKGWGIHWVMFQQHPCTPYY